jgi:hypothetical protein
MKAYVKKLDEAQVRTEFPIEDRVAGWFFRVREQSAGIWHAEGTDLWGRTVGETGTDERAILHNCIVAAERINSQLCENQ